MRWIAMILIPTIVTVPTRGEDYLCKDTRRSCRKIDHQLPLYRCYEPEHYDRCCETCEKLKRPIPGCPWGDRGEFCSQIGRSTPVGDCYGANTTCCQSCRVFDTGIPGCPFGDRVTWCNDIGRLYSVSSCYDHEIHCCDTCTRLKTQITGCPYGDRMPWCQEIGRSHSILSCQLNHVTCCQTCHLLHDQLVRALESLKTTNEPLPDSPSTAVHSPSTVVRSPSTVVRSTFPSNILNNARTTPVDDFITTPVSTSTQPITNSWSDHLTISSTYTIPKHYNDDVITTSHIAKIDKNDNIIETEAPLSLTPSPGVADERLKEIVESSADLSSTASSVTTTTISFMSIPLSSILLLINRI